MPQTQKAATASSVSVIIPSYEPGEKIASCLSSILDTRSDQVFDLRLGDPLERIASLGVDQERVAGTQLADRRRRIFDVIDLGDTSQWLREQNHPFFVRVPDDQRTG